LSFCFFLFTFLRSTSAESNIVSLDLGGKLAVVTGVGDNESFAWFIAKRVTGV